MTQLYKISLKVAFWTFDEKCLPQSKLNVRINASNVTHKLHEIIQMELFKFSLIQAFMLFV